ncbi:MAG: element excision factor XisH family protein [Bacteroidota bacterium]
MAKDIFHDLVREALEKEGWEITHDPFTIKLKKRNMYIDLGAEKLLTAEKDNRRIAVEVKSFLNLSPLTDFYHALGQYQLYFLALKKEEADRALYLAIPKESYEVLNSDELLAEFLTELNLKYIVFDPTTKGIEQWIN